MSPRNAIATGLRLLLSLLIGVAPGFIIGILLGASHYPWRFESQQLFFFVFLITGGAAVALCPLAVGAENFRKCLKWCAIGLIGGVAESALAGAVGWWVDPPAVFAAAFVWWGVVFGAWCGWLRGKILSGALLGLLLTSLLAGVGFFIAHPDPAALFGGIIGLLAGTLVYKWRNDLFMWSARLAVVGLVIASAVIICILRGTYWTPTTIFRVVDSASSSGSHHACFQPLFGDRALTSHGDAICLWDVKSGWRVSTIKRHWSCDLTWQSRDDPVCVQVSKDGRVQKWDVFRQELLADAMISEFQVNPPLEYQLNQWINPYRTSLSRDGRLSAVLVPSENRIALVDFPKRNIEVASLGDLPPLSALVLSSDGRKLLLGSSDHQTMFLCDCETGTPQLVRTYANVFPPQGKMLFSADDRRACVFGGRLEAGALRIVDLEQKDIVLDFSDCPRRIINAAFSRDSLLLLTAERENIVRLWDATTGKELRCFRQHQSWIMRTLFDRTLGDGIDAVAISPDGQWGLASSSGGTVSRWRLADH